MPVPVTVATAVEPACDVSELNRRMTNMPRQMRTFSLALRSLYAENAVTGSKSADTFRR